MPGSGKTILAQRYAFTNGTLERPALYISTVSEPLDKIVRFGQTLSFFDVDAVGTRVIYEDIGNDLAEERPCRPSPHGSRRCCCERLPGVVVIDSFKALTPYASDARDYRMFLHQPCRLPLGDHAARASGSASTASDEIATAPEFAVADSVIASARALSATAPSACWRCSSCAAAATRPGSTATG